MKTLLSIDIGTTSVKAALFDTHGQVLASASASYAVEYPRPGWAQEDPDDWWRAFCALVPRVLQSADTRELAGVCISGQTPSCLPVDAGGRPLRPAILWLDRRSAPQVEWLREHVGEDRCRNVSTNRLDSYYGGPKWLWFQQNEPEILARTWKLLQANTYVIFHLTGQAVIDPSQAGVCSPCFNTAARAWDPGILSEMSIPMDVLPEIIPSIGVVGPVSAAAARESGLPEGLPVICGGADFACSCLGTGITRPTQAALMLGTAGNLLFPGRISRDPRLLHAIHLTGEPLPFGAVFAGGNLTWFARLMGDSSPDIYKRLDEEAALVPPGSEGLIFLPYLMGERTPIWDPDARGAFIGLSSRHTRAHLFRAVLEGVALAFRQIADIAGMEGLESLVAIDGGARSPLWRSILASALGLPVCQGSERSGTTLGAAFLAAMGTGNATSFEEIGQWAEISATTQPDPAAAKVYDALNPVFAGLYPKLKEDFDRLNSL
jgi:xylulokinase